MMLRSNLLRNQSRGKTWSLLFLLIFIFGGLLGPIFSPFLQEKTFAGPDSELVYRAPENPRKLEVGYVDITRIKVNLDFDGTEIGTGRKITYTVAKDFVDSDHYDERMEYTADTGCSDKSKIKIKNNTFGGADAEFVLRILNPFDNSKCIGRRFDVKIANVPNRSHITHRYVAQDKIESLGSGGFTYGQASNDPKKFIANSEDCIFTFRLATTNSGRLTANCTDGEWREGVSDDKFNSRFGSINLLIDNSPTKPASPASGSGANASDNDAADCESEAGPFGWVLCGVISGLANASDAIFTNIIEPLLLTDPIDTSPSSTNYKVWSNFRIYGNIFLILALLVVVFGQSIGGGLIEAYAAKKILPRLLVAAILINLSLYLVAFAVDITNVLGKGVGALIQAPFGDEFKIKVYNEGSSALGVAALMTGAGAIWVTGGAFLPWLFFTLLVPMFFVFVAILALIIIRNGLIIFLILIAPVAFALYCLPNTEKYFKQWWDLLWKTLLIYPIIAIIFAIANVMSVTMTNTGGAFSELLAIVALVIPLFAIPFAFKFAGGVMSKVSDVVNGSTAKVNGMMKGRREQAAFKAKQSRAGTMQKYNNAFNRSTVGQSLGNIPGVTRLQSRRTASLDQLNRSLGADMGKTAGAQAIQHDDPALRAATYSSYRQAVKGLMSEEGGGMTQADAERAAGAASASIGFGRSQALWATEQMAKTGTAFENQQDQARVIARASGGDASGMASLAGNLNSVNKQVGRHDLSPSFGTLLEQAQLEAASPSTPAEEAALVAKKNQVYSQGQENAWNSASLYQHANDKPQNLKAAVKHFEGVMSNPGASMKDLEGAAVFFNELRAMAPNATGAVKEVIDESWAKNEKTVNSVVAGLPPTPGSGGTAVPGSGEKTVRQIQMPDGSTHEDIVVGPDKIRPPESAADRVARRTRTFERIDPNRI